MHSSRRRLALAAVALAPLALALSPAAAQAIFDTVIGPLRTALRAVAVLGLVLALVGFFAGGTRAAAATRRVIGGGFETIDRRRKQRSASMVEAQLWRLRYVVRLGVPIIAAFVLMFWHYPTGMVVFWVVVVACLILAAFEFAIAPARRGVAAGSVVAEDLVAESAGPVSSEIVVTETVVTETPARRATSTIRGRLLMAPTLDPRGIPATLLSKSI